MALNSRTAALREKFIYQSEPQLTEVSLHFLLCYFCFKIFLSIFFLPVVTSGLIVKKSTSYAVLADQNGSLHISHYKMIHSYTTACTLLQREQLL